MLERGFDASVEAFCIDLLNRKMQLMVIGFNGLCDILDIEYF